MEVEVPMNWQCIRRAAFAVVLAAGAPALVGAVETAVGIVEIQRAIEIGRRGGTGADRFHGPYTLQIGHPTVLSFEVITEFRRVVLATEEQARLGNRLFGARDAERILHPWRGRVSIVAHLRFNPQNVLVRVPDYQMLLAGAPGTKEMLPIDVRRLPFYADTAIIGADIEGIFDAAPLALETRTIVLQLPPGQVAAAGVDFASLQ
jgi:hypothetical protein